MVKQNLVRVPEIQENLRACYDSDAAPEGGLAQGAGRGGGQHDFKKVGVLASADAMCTHARFICAVPVAIVCVCVCVCVCV